MISITIPPPIASETRLPNSKITACGRRAMIPIIMIKEIPLPTPLSVIRSPSQRMNIEPAARIIVAGIINVVQSIPDAKAPAACIFKFIR